MTQFICPSCGSKYFLNSKVGQKIIFNVGCERKVQVIQVGTGDSSDIDKNNIYCGACSWQGSLVEVVESQRD